MMRAQVTLEYLFLSLLALALLSFSVLALANIKITSQKSFDMIVFKGTVNELGAAMAEVCALGNGNARSVYIKRDLNVEGFSDYARFTDIYLGESLPRETYCEVEDADGMYGKTKIMNEEGVIRLESA